MRGIQEQRGAKMGQFSGDTDRFDEALARDALRNLVPFLQFKKR